MLNLWQKNPNAKIDICADMVSIIDETPLAVHIRGECGSFGPYVL